MKLRYRGIEYDRQSTPDKTADVEAVGKYRGNPCPISKTVAASPSAAQHPGKYRGVDVVWH